MAKTTVRIIVEGNGGSSGNAESAARKKAEKKELEQWKASPLYKMLNLSDTVKEKIQAKTTPAQNLALVSFANLAMSTVKQTANYFISDIGRANGDSNYQAIVNRQIEVVVDDVGGFLTGALGGAVAGSAVPVIGPLIGAVMGVAAHGISTIFKYAERDRAYQHELFKDEVKQSYNLARANGSVWTGRLR